jgi:hypothetical protein
VPRRKRLNREKIVSYCNCNVSFPEKIGMLALYMKNPIRGETRIGR